LTIEDLRLTIEKSALSSQLSAVSHQVSALRVESRLTAEGLSLAAWFSIFNRNSSIANSL
jgi:hypothetical protein